MQKNDLYLYVFNFQIPGKVLRGGLRESWTCPNPGWIQYCDAVEVDEHGLVSRIAGAPLDMNRIYRVGSFIDFDTDYGTPSIHQYYQTEEGKKGIVLQQAHFRRF